MHGWQWMLNGFHSQRAVQDANCGSKWGIRAFYKAKLLYYTRYMYQQHPKLANQHKSKTFVAFYWQKLGKIISQDWNLTYSLKEMGAKKCACAKHQEMGMRQPANFC